MPEAGWIGALELGGTKTVVAIGTAEGRVAEEMRFPTGPPQETLGTAADWLAGRGPLQACHMGSFGPLRVDPQAADFGTMLATPKPGWAGYSLTRHLTSRFPGIPLRLDTDVNAAALAECRLGAAQGHPDMAYITIGTGIGAGVLSGGRLIHGHLHPEFGHLRVPRFPGETDFTGVCPFHGDCLEGLASGPAMAARWGKPAHELAADHPAWEQEAWHLAQGILSLVAILSCTRVVLGGGVSQAPGLHERVNRTLARLSNGYYPQTEGPEPFVVPPALGQEAGIRGALLLGAV